MLTKLTTFAPDLDPTTPGVITDCGMLVPTVRGYKGAEGILDAGMDAVTAATRGAAVVTLLAGTRRIFVGTAAKLYEQNGAAWDDASKDTTASSYALGTDDTWRFAQFGNTTIAATISNKLQSSTSTGDFAEISAAPKAACVDTAQGFVVVANTFDSSNSTQQDRWWCSAYQDHTSWTTSVSTQATSGRLVETPGPIRGLKRLGDLIVAYKESSIYIGRYVGAPVVWQWTLIPGDIGCASQESVVNIGAAHVFVGPNNFYYFDGTRPVPIGDPVRDWFFSDANVSYRYKTIGYHDKATATIYFHYVSRRSTLGSLDACIAYNWKSQKWGLAHRNVECVLEYISQGVTWDSLGDLGGGTWDTLPDVSYDSPFWISGSPVYAYFDENHTLQQVSGPSLTSYLVTGDIGDDEYFSTLNQVRPRFFDTPTTCEATHYHASDLGDELTTGATSSMANGKIDLLSSDRWHRLKLTMTGDHEISAFDVRLIKNGTS